MLLLNGLGLWVMISGSYGQEGAFKFLRSGTVGFGEGLFDVPGYDLVESECG
jgi:hypothetical protein